MRITYMKGDGTTETGDMTVEPKSRSTVVVKDRPGEGDDEAHDFSARVVCAIGEPILVERPMYFNYRGIYAGGHDVVGATTPARQRTYPPTGLFSASVWAAPATRR